MAISTYLSKITLNVNGLNAPIKRYRVADWIKKTRPFYMLSTRNSLQIKRHRLKVRVWKKMFHANKNEKKVGVTIFISEKIDFKTKAITKTNPKQLRKWS